MNPTIGNLREAIYELGCCLTHCTHCHVGAKEHCELMLRVMMLTLKELEARNADHVRGAIGENSAHAA